MAIKTRNRYMAQKFNKAPQTVLADKWGVWAVYDIVRKAYVLTGNFQTCEQFVYDHNPAPRNA